MHGGLVEGRGGRVGRNSGGLRGLGRSVLRMKTGAWGQEKEGKRRRAGKKTTQARSNG